MRFGHILRLVAPNDPDRKHIRGNQDFLGHIGTESAYDLAAGALLPLLGIGMAVYVPLLKFLNHVVPPIAFVRQVDLMGRLVSSRRSEERRVGKERRSRW